MTVPKLENFFRSLQKWGTTIHHFRFFGARLRKLLHFRLEVGEAIRYHEALPNLERSLRFHFMRASVAQAKSFSNSSKMPSAFW